MIRMTKPAWMTDEQYAEYKMTEEYRVEMNARDISCVEPVDDEDCRCYTPKLEDDIDNVISIINNSDMSDEDKYYCIGVILEAKHCVED